MRYLILGQGWPVTGDKLVPAGTIISLPARGGDHWSALATGKVPPMNAQALDQQAYDVLVQAYGVGKLVPR
jgi:hypothetical protein